MKTASAKRGTPNEKIKQPEHSRSNWYFSREEIEKRSPSRLDGINLEVETEFRRSYCSFLRELGKRLRVSPVTIATAIVFTHRFYLRQSHSKNDRYAVATSCMFLAGKAEDNPRPLKHVVIKSYELRHGEQGAVWSLTDIHNKDVYLKQKELVLLGERLVLVTLGFDLNIDQPYKPLAEAIGRFHIKPNFAQAARNFVNDGLLTSLSLQFKADQIAAGAILLASKLVKVKLPIELIVWWQELKVTGPQLREVCDQILELYVSTKTQSRGV